MALAIVDFSSLIRILSAAWIATGASSHAAVLAYEGFNTGAGGYDASGTYANPTLGPSNALVWDADSAAGGSFGQSPVSLGFSANAWTQFGSVTQAATVYPRVQTSQTMSYTTAAQQRLNTTAGEVSIFRSGGAASGSKAFSRDLSLGASTTFTPTLYFSGLFTFTNSVVPASITTASTTTGNTRAFGMNILADGSVQAFGSSATTTSSAAGTVAAGQTYLFIWKVEDGSVTGSGDRITIYLNPVDLSAEAGNTSTVSTTSTATGTPFYVYNNAAWTLGYLSAGATVGNGDQFITDEIRIGNTWADVLPYTLVPEPATAGLLALGILAALRRRRN